MMTTSEAAEVLGLKPGTIRTYIKRGLIDATKKGRDYLISSHEVYRFKKERNPRGWKSGQPRKPNTTVFSTATDDSKKQPEP